MSHLASTMGWPALGTTVDELSGRRMSSALNSIPLVRANKPEIDIKLDDEQAGCFVPSYTTLDKIQGKVSITCENDMPYDGVHIIFQGAAKTFVEKIATSTPTTPRTRAYHNFLRLVQPLDEGEAGAELPIDQILRAGKKYNIPFTFVVPDRLLPQACTHEKAKDSVHDAHLVPPPSFGDPMMAGDGKSLLDDLAPNMTMISYGIRVILTRKERSNSNSTSKPKSLADAMKKLRIIPATEEQPPLTTREEDDDYLLCRTKRLKKGIFKGKLGTLSMSAPQPAPLRLPFIRSERSQTTHTTTMATVDLVFEPYSATAKPPKLGQLWAKLKCATFYGTVPMKDFPSKSSPFMYDSQRGIFVETLPLSSRSVASTQWTKVDPSSPLSRRDSGISVAALPPSSPDTPSTPSGLHYTARVLVPVDLPTTSKSFVPTFHTCLISRIYALDLALQTQSPPASVGGKKVPGVSAGGSTTLHLKLPLQIIQEGNANATPVISDAEAAHIRAREADLSFVPRSMAPPPLTEGSPNTASGSGATGAATTATGAPAAAGTPGSTSFVWTRGFQPQGDAAYAIPPPEDEPLRTGSPEIPGSPTDHTAERLADLQLRGARGSVFVAPRWGSAAWGPINPSARARASSNINEEGGENAENITPTGAQDYPGSHPGANLGDHPGSALPNPFRDNAAAAYDFPRRGSDALWSRRNSDEEVEIIDESQNLDAALHDEAPAQNTHRQRQNDAPPGYTAFNGVVTRRGGASMWT